MTHSSLDDVPAAVYRIQLRPEFPLKRVIQALPYLDELGIDGIYLSPLFLSVEHGYAVTDPNRIHPAISSQEEYARFVTLLKERNMQQVLDVVPNHMGIKGKGNRWWLDVLEYGPYSSFAEFFDIDWSPEKPSLKNKVLLPILKDQYGASLAQGQIQLTWDEGFWVTYQDYFLPIAIHTYQDIVALICHVSDRRDEERLYIAPEIQSIIGSAPTPENLHVYKQEFVQYVERFPLAKEQCSALISWINQKEQMLARHAILEKQWYRLSHWLVASQEINYRRFFNINELAAIHLENEKVLKEHHRWIFLLLEENRVQGLRIDHPDGLYDPTGYFDALQQKKPGFVIVEKVLDFKETLPEMWSVQGTEGYDFLNALNGVFVQKRNQRAMMRIYKKIVGKVPPFTQLLYERKRNVIASQKAGELNELGRKLDQISELDIRFRDFTRGDLTDALKAIIACFPVYRTYIRPGEVRKRDRQVIIKAIEQAKLHTPEIDPPIYAFINDVLLLELTDFPQKPVMDFVLRFQQLTAPIHAKGLEDSVFYNYNLLISLNEVGGYPDQFGTSVRDFHAFNITKRKHWPLGFLASSTHDSKWSEDTRMRLHVLSEIPEMWEELVKDWRKINRRWKTKIGKCMSPDDNAEYYLYQMLLGIWPEEGATPSFVERVHQMMRKAIREAGVETNWRTPNTQYEEAMDAFVNALLSPNSSYGFLSSFVPFQKTIAKYGQYNSLSALVLKLGSPGIVHLYQGNEHWTFRGVDPDNRGIIAIDTMHIHSFPSFPSNHKDLKKFITMRGLQMRKTNKELFLLGEYIPLSVASESAIAFLRKYENRWAFIVVGRFFTHERHSWDIEVEFPKTCKVSAWKDIFTDQIVHVQPAKNRKTVSLKEVFTHAPFALLTNVDS